MNSKQLLASALVLASTQLAVADSHNHKHKAKAKSSVKGKCYGVVGAGKGECGGKDPKTGETWSCAGHNPSASTGWKKMTEDECNNTEKHPKAKKRYFESGKV